MKHAQLIPTVHLASIGEAWCNSYQDEKKFQHYFGYYEDLFRLNSFQLGVLAAIHFY